MRVLAENVFEVFASRLVLVDEVEFRVEMERLRPQGARDDAGFLDRFKKNKR